MNAQPRQIWIGTGIVLAACLGVVIGVGWGPYGALAMCAFASVIALLAQPQAFVLFYAATRPLADAFVFAKIGGFTLGQLWGAGLVAILLTYVFLRAISPARDRVLELPRLAVPAGFVLTYALLTMWRPDQAYAAQNVLKLASWLLLIFVVEDICRTSRGRAMTLSAGSFSAVLLLSVIAQAVLTNQYGAAYYAGAFLDRSQGPHGISSMAVMVAALLLLAIVQRKARLLNVVLLGGLAAGVVLSLVRTTLVALIIVMVAYLLWSLRGRSPKQVFAATTLFAALGGVVYAFQDSVADRLQDLDYLVQGGAGTVWAGGGRIGIWLAVIVSSTSDWATFVFGRGAGSTFALAYQAMGARVWAHNDFLEFLGTGGILLLGAYAFVVGWMWRSAARRPVTQVDRDDPYWGVRAVALGAVVAFVFMAFFNGMAFYQASVIAAVVVGYVRGLRSSIDARPDGGDPA